MRFVSAALVAFVLAGVLAAQVPPPSQQPRFRAGVNFVRVDVYPTAGGRAVPDLAQEEFEVLEDGVPQKIVSFEHVALRPAGPTAERAEPESVTEGNRMASDPRNRLFVLFLDTYHVTDETSSHDGRLRLPGDPTRQMPRERRLLGPSPIDRALMAFVDRVVSPTDLVAALTPEMDGSLLTFTRRSESFDELLRSAWGRRYSWDNLDPEEERWAFCYVPDCEYHCWDGILEEMVLRRREKRTLDTLQDAVAHLAGLREERKAIIAVSEGWRLFRPNRQLARPVARGCSRDCPVTVPGPPGVYVGMDGKPKIGADERDAQGADWHACEVARVNMAQVDNALIYRDLLDRANRANASFYPVDPRGLAVFDTPIDAVSPSAPGTMAPSVKGVIADQTELKERLESLRTLATATDGRAMLDSNDLNSSLQKIADDLSDYYLLGYNSTNDKPDGTFRKITVRVKRPGVAVRARRGYRAATEAELAERRTAAAFDADADARGKALSILTGIRPDRPLHVAAGYGWAPGAAPAAASPRPFIWVVAEVDFAAARRPEWSSGAEATVTVSRTGSPDVTTGEMKLPALSPRAMLVLHDVLVNANARGDIVPGEYLLQVRARATLGSVLPASEQVRLTVPAPPARSLGEPLLFRRGPYTGGGFQATADLRFRKAERLRADLPLTTSCDSFTARVLDRNGQPLAIPVTTATREETNVRFATAEVALAPLAQADYLLEITARVGTGTEKRLIAFRVVP